MLISEFDYHLPDDLIAQEPLETRENSRMLTINRESKSWRDKYFFDFPSMLKKDDVVVLNNTKVFPARLLGVTETDAKVEIFLVSEIESQIWETLARPARRLKVGKRVLFDNKLAAEILEKNEDGRLVVRFEADGNFEQILDEIGKTPLPPYIRREDVTDNDRKRYQTVFASQRGAIAAPTAGLHFSPAIIKNIEDAGITIAEITLHVGYGTFEPVRVNDLTQHTVMPEKYEISSDTAQIIQRARSEKRRIIAIGTTTTRALESAVSDNGMVSAGSGLAKLTITPNYNYQVISGLLTNFHLPRSSLLVLVSTFGGHELIMDAYNYAVESGYRFYSYGDCMFIT